MVQNFNYAIINIRRTNTLAAISGFQRHSQRVACEIMCFNIYNFNMHHQNSVLIFDWNLGIKTKLNRQNILYSSITK
jgi:hypothetical protein